MYKELRIGKIGNSKVISFATDELVKYLNRIDNDLQIDILTVDSVTEEFENIIWLGVDEKLSPYVPEVSDKSLDDAISVSIKKNAGFITGANERSVLIAVYMFLKELGCDWVRPSSEGERIRKSELFDINVELCHKPSYRHRGVCIEGQNSYENIKDIIDYLPKVGMNEYFIQFITPSNFFMRWYEHAGNPHIKGKKISRAEVDAFVKSLEAEIEKRGLSYQTVGHGWTCEPFGIDGGSWKEYDGEEISPDIKQYFAKIDGKREFKDGIPLATNLCYSNKKVRDIMIDAIVSYCEEHKNVDAVHFWLADSSNSHCECEKCIKKRPSDWYILMLNELDKRLTENGIDTKIVFLIYFDLLWEPVEEKLNNPDRFIIMFAPITRVYGSNYVDFLEYNKELPPFVYNKLQLPDSLDQNIEHLRRWQKGFSGDSFIYDYHLVWPYTNDLGGESCARNLSDDMKGLKVLGLNGSVKCQMQRCYYPSALPFNMMAESLWDRECDFDEKADNFYLSAYGKDGLHVRKYLKTLSDNFLTYQGPKLDFPKGFSKFCKDYKAVEVAISDFLPILDNNLNEENVYTKDWQFLRMHTEYVQILKKVFLLVEDGKIEEAKPLFDEATDMLLKNELLFQKIYDATNVVGVWQKKMERFFK